MKKLFILIHIIVTSACFAEGITPFKFTDSFPDYQIPESSRFTTPYPEHPEVIYYFSAPDSDHYPIAILSGGSSSLDYLHSIIHFHRYFLQEFIDLNIGVITIEQHGIDGGVINAQEFMAHYTRTNRLKEHQLVIDHLINHPPKGWNGNFIFVGVSEGGPLVTSLTTLYPNNTLATINWSGAGDFLWREELWAFCQKMLLDNPCCPHETPLQECLTCSELITSRDSYDALMDATILHPTADQYFMNMTYKYHADAQLYPPLDFKKIKTPFLVVAGGMDSIIDSTDAFIAKAKDADVDVTYLRIEDMDHYVRKRPDVIHQSFEWLKKQL